MAYNYTETDILRNTPKSPGVYRIYNRILGVYVGEAEDMEERLLRHRRGHSDKSACIDSYSDPKQCEHEIVYGGKSARLQREGMDPSIWLSVLNEIHKSIQPTREPQAAISCFDGLQERMCVVSSCTPDNRLVAHTLGLLGGPNA